MTCIAPITRAGCEAWTCAHKSEIQKRRVTQNRRLTMNGKYPRTTKVSFLHAYFSILKLNGCLQFLVKIAYEKIIFNYDEPVSQLYVEAVQSPFRMHKDCTLNERR